MAGLTGADGALGAVSVNFGIGFFLSRLQELDKGFEGLFGNRDDGEELDEVSSRSSVSFWHI